MQNYTVSICNAGIIENNQSVFLQTTSSINYPVKDKNSFGAFNEENCFFEQSTLYSKIQKIIPSVPNSLTLTQNKYM